jgi:hypothetical protein
MHVSPLGHAKRSSHGSGRAPKDRQAAASKVSASGAPRTSEVIVSLHRRRDGVGAAPFELGRCGAGGAVGEHDQLVLEQRQIEEHACAMRGLAHLPLGVAGQRSAAHLLVDLGGRDERAAQRRHAR